MNFYNFKKFAVSLPEYSATPSNESIAVQGNIDLTKRPIVKNKDGSISTVRSISFFEPETGLEVLVPTVSDEGKIMSDEDAKSYYYKTKKHLAKEVEKTYGNNIIGTGVKAIVNKMYDSGMKSKFRWD